MSSHNSEEGSNDRNKSSRRSVEPSSPTIRSQESGNPSNKSSNLNGSPHQGNRLSEDTEEHSAMNKQANKASDEGKEVLHDRTSSEDHPKDKNESILQASIYSPKPHESANTHGEVEGSDRSSGSDLPKESTEYPYKSRTRERRDYSDDEESEDRQRSSKRDHPEKQRISHRESRERHRRRSHSEEGEVGHRVRGDEREHRAGGDEARGEEKDKRGRSRREGRKSEERERRHGIRQEERHRSHSGERQERNESRKRRKRSRSREKRDRREGKRRDEESPSQKGHDRIDRSGRSQRGREGHDEAARDKELLEKNSAEKADELPKAKKEPLDLLRTRTGGAYIPPAKLKMMQEQIGDKNSEQYQRMNWERLKKKIHGQVNKANTGNLVNVVRDLLQENIIRGKGLLARSIIQAQSFSPTFSNVYAALVAVINSKFPHIGELILRRLIVQFKRSFRRNDKATTVTVSKFIAHLINQQVAHEILALELMILLLENPTDDSVEVTIAFLKECGAKLTELSPKGVNSIFDRLRSILSEAEIDKRVQYMIEVIFHVRKDKFQAFPAVAEELDLIDEDDQITHTITLEDAVNPENELNVFKYDTEFEKNEAIYDEIRREIIGEPGESSEEEDDEGESGEDDAYTEQQKQQEAKVTIVDNTEQNLVAFRRNVYLTIQSSLDFQEAAHKLLKIDLKSGQDVEMCNMIVDCCAQQRTYESFYGLLAERFCRLRKEFQEAFERIARDTYNTIHRFEITKLRNMARLVAHLLSTDAISWNVLDEISLNEEDTTSAGRIYIKIVFQELAEFMSVEKLMERIRDPTMQGAFDKIFPRDNPNNTRFSINFFTSIGLGYLTMDLRKHLQQSHKKKTEEVEESSSSSSTSDSDSSDSDSSDSDSTSSSDSSSDDEKKKKRKKRKVIKEEEPDESTEKENHLPDLTTVKQEPLSPEQSAHEQGSRKERERARDDSRQEDRERHKRRGHDDEESGTYQTRRQNDEEEAGEHERGRGKEHGRRHEKSHEGGVRAGQSPDAHGSDPGKRNREERASRKNEDEKRESHESKRKDEEQLEKYRREKRHPRKESPEHRKREKKVGEGKEDEGLPVREERVAGKKREEDDKRRNDSRRKEKEARGEEKNAEELRERDGKRTDDCTRKGERETRNMRDEEMRRDDYRTNDRDEHERSNYRNRSPSAKERERRHNPEQRRRDRRRSGSLEERETKRSKRD